MTDILLINGPNLNLLGKREPEIYGSTTLIEIEQSTKAHLAKAGLVSNCMQANGEHLIVDAIHTAWDQSVKFIIINPGAFTHTSVAIRDALLATKIPFIELHLSNVFARETFRHHSYLSDIAHGVICGFGPLGYQLAADAAITFLKTTSNK